MKIELKDRLDTLKKVQKAINQITTSQTLTRTEIIKEYNNNWIHKLFGIKFKLICDLDTWNKIRWDYPDSLYTLKRALQSNQTGAIYLNEKEYNLIK